MSIKITHLSDTHNLHHSLKIEMSGIIIHSGDATNLGTIPEVSNFLSWFGKLPHSYKIFCAGNHDWLFETNTRLAKELCKEHGVIWLQNETIELEGLKLYGTADQPEFCNWAFNKPPHELLQSYSNIPDDIDVLVTHAPACGMRDMINSRSVGSPELSYHLNRLKNLKLHAFGHIHASSGLTVINNIYYSNGAICNEAYKPVNPVNIFYI
jgi:hypothetical protein